MDFKYTDAALYLWQGLPPNLKDDYPTPLEAFKAGLLEGIKSPLEKFPIYVKTGKNEQVFNIDPAKYQDNWYQHLTLKIAKVLQLPAVDLYHDEDRLDRWGLANIYRIHTAAEFTLAVRKTPLSPVVKAAENVATSSLNLAVNTLALPANLWLMFSERLDKAVYALMDDEAERANHMMRLTDPNYTKGLVSQIVDDATFIIPETTQTFMQALLELGFVFPGKFIDAVAQSVSQSAMRTLDVFAQQSKPMQSSANMKKFFKQTLELTNIGGWMDSLRKGWMSFKKQFFSIDAHLHHGSSMKMPKVSNGRSRRRPIRRTSATVVKAAPGEEILVGFKYHETMEDLHQQQVVGARILTAVEGNYVSVTKRGVRPGATIHFELSRLRSKFNKLRRIRPPVFIAIFANDAKGKIDFNRCDFVLLTERYKDSEHILNEFWQVPDIAGISSWTICYWYASRELNSRTRISWGKFGKNTSTPESADWTYKLYVDNTNSIDEVLQRSEDPERNIHCWLNIYSPNGLKTGLLPLPSKLTEEAAIVEIDKRIKFVYADRQEYCNKVGARYSSSRPRIAPRASRPLARSTGGRSRSNSRSPSPSSKKPHGYSSGGVGIQKPGIDDPHNGAPGIKHGMPPTGRASSVGQRMGMAGDARIDRGRLTKDIVAAHGARKADIPVENLVKVVQMLESYPKVPIYKAFFRDTYNRRRISTDYTKHGLQVNPSNDNIGFDREGIYLYFETEPDLIKTYQSILEDPEGTLLPALIYANNGKELPLKDATKLTPVCTLVEGGRPTNTLPKFPRTSSKEDQSPTLMESLSKDARIVEEATLSGLSAVEGVLMEAVSELNENIVQPTLSASSSMAKKLTSSLPVVGEASKVASDVVDEVVKDVQSPVGSKANAMQRRKLSCEKVLNALPEIALNHKIPPIEAQANSVLIARLINTYPEIQLASQYSKYTNIEELQKWEDEDYPDLQFVEGSKNHLGYEKGRVLFIHRHQFNPFTEIHATWAQILREPELLGNALRGAAGGEERELVSEAEIAAKSLKGQLFTEEQNEGFIGVNVHTFGPDGNVASVTQIPLPKDTTVGDLLNKLKHKYKRFRHKHRKLGKKHHHVKIASLLESGDKSGYVTLVGEPLVPIGAKASSGIKLLWEHDGKKHTLAGIDLGFKVGHIRQLIAREMGIAAADINLFLSDIGLVKRDEDLLKNLHKKGHDHISFVVKTEAKTPLGSMKEKVGVTPLDFKASASGSASAPLLGKTSAHVSVSPSSGIKASGSLADVLASSKEKIAISTSGIKASATMSSPLLGSLEVGTSGVHGKARMSKPPMAALKEPKGPRTYKKVDEILHQIATKSDLLQSNLDASKVYIVIGPYDYKYDARKVAKGQMSAFDYLAKYIYLWENPSSRGESRLTRPLAESGSKKANKSLKLMKDRNAKSKAFTIVGKGKGDLVKLTSISGYTIYKFIP